MIKVRFNRVSSFFGSEIAFFGHKVPKKPEEVRLAGTYNMHPCPSLDSVPEHCIWHPASLLSNLGASAVPISVMRAVRNPLLRQRILDCQGGRAGGTARHLVLSPRVCWHNWTRKFYSATVWRAHVQHREREIETSSGHL